MIFLNDKKFTVVVILAALLAGFALGYFYLMANISDIKKQELKILGTKQGTKGKTILEALADVEESCSLIIKELPLRFEDYKIKEKELLNEMEILTKDYEVTSKELIELKEEFFNTKDIQLRSELGIQAFDKIIVLNEILQKTRKVDENRLENTYQYSNYMYRLIERVLYAYGFEKIQTGALE